MSTLRGQLNDNLLFPCRQSHLRPKSLADGVHSYEALDIIGELGPGKPQEAGVGEKMAQGRVKGLSGLF